MTAKELVVRDLCELDRADWDSPHTICVHIEDAERIVERYVAPEWVVAALDTANAMLTAQGYAHTDLRAARDYLARVGGAK